MQFNIINTEPIYRRILAAPDAAERERIFRAEIIAPFAPLLQVFGGGDAVAAFERWNMPLSLFDPENHAQMTALLDGLAGINAWEQAAQSLEDARAAFAPDADRIALKKIVFALLTMKHIVTPEQRGYTGFGGFPGYIMTVYSEVNDYNSTRVKGTTVHELHHNVRFTLFPFNMMSTTVADYIIAEGLAESFSAELYGEDVVGFYVTDFNAAQIEQARTVIGGALNVTGFNEIRGYIFGDTIAGQTGAVPAGVPSFAGYAIGYRVVQAYLKRTGKTVAEATFLPAMDIITESGFFE